MRVGIVAYTNTLPLAHDLERHLPGAELVRGEPSLVARGLESGELDAGIVPVAALAAHPGWRTVPGLGIASRGPVRSVRLLSRAPLDRAERLIEDPASRTSNVLARLWLRHALGRTLPAEPGGGRIQERLQPGAVSVCIGDEALHLDDRGLVSVDLGAAWTEWTGHAFVYAMWAGPRAGEPGLAEAFAACYRENAERLGALAALEAAGDPERAARLEAYLRENIHYLLGPAEEAGMARFLRLAAEAGHLPATERTLHAGA
jgi:chorismate dehydratase